MLVVIEDLAVGGNNIICWADTRFRILVGKRDIHLKLKIKKVKKKKLKKKKKKRKNRKK